MTEPRTILLVGGKADGRIVTILHGNSVLMAQPGAPSERYEIVQLAGKTLSFNVGVPVDRADDGDWLIDRLLARYAGEASA